MKPRQDMNWSAWLLPVWAPERRARPGAAGSPGCRRGCPVCTRPGLGLREVIESHWWSCSVTVQQL